MDLDTLSSKIDHFVRVFDRAFFFDGKTEYFWSFLDLEARKSNRSIHFYRSKKKCFHRSRTEWPFWSGVCPNLYILPCKITFAFTTLVRNGHLRVSGSKNRTKVFSFIVQKKMRFHRSRTEWPFWVGSVSKTMYFAMQNDPRLHHSRTEWPFSDIRAMKWRFRARAVKAKVVFDRKIQCYLLLRRTFWSSGVVLGPRGPSKMGKPSFLIESGVVFYKSCYRSRAKCAFREQSGHSVREWRRW